MYISCERKRDRNVKNYEKRDENVIKTHIALTALHNDRVVFQSRDWLQQHTKLHDDFVFQPRKYGDPLNNVRVEDLH